MIKLLSDPKAHHKLFCCIHQNQHGYHTTLNYKGKHCSLTKSGSIYSSRDPLYCLLSFSIRTRMRLMLFSLILRSPQFVLIWVCLFSKHQCQ